MGRKWPEEVGTWLLFLVTHKKQANTLYTSPSSNRNGVGTIQWRLPGIPQFPPIFSIPRLMTHLWRKQLSKDTDVFFTLNVGRSFYHCSMHERLAVLIFCRWLMFQTKEVPGCYRGISTALKVKDHIDSGFKNPELHRFWKLHELEGPVHVVRDSRGVE